MKKSLIIFSLCFLLLIGFVSGFSLLDFFEKFTGKVVDYSNQPYCSGIGTRSEHWRNSERFIKYDSCGNCEAVCKLARDKIVEGWYSSCDEGLILEEECDCADTCLNLGYECGVQNVCGENINCGRCRLGQVCNKGICEECIPETCESLNYKCGEIDDGCGGTLGCGRCRLGQVCNNGVCEECIPETCESLNYKCGEIDDGCGGTLGCGSCVTGYDCVNGRCERVEGNETDNNKLCKKEGEQVNKNPFLGSVEECCEGLIEVRISKSYSNCVNCGDKICRDPEDENNCPQDCKEEMKCSDGTLMKQCSKTKPKYCELFNLDSGEPISIEEVLNSEPLLFEDCLRCGCPDGSVCQEGGSCKVGIEDFEISIATLKNLYEVGEQIKLTDPPDSSIMNNKSKIITGLISEDGLRDNIIISDEIGIDLNSEVYSTFEGYIIQLEGDPMAIKLKQLKEEAERNEGNTFMQVAEVILPEFLEPVLLSNIEDKIEKERNNLRKKRNDFKQNILSILGNDKVVLREYENVFNGIALDINSEEVFRIEKLKGVEKVYPNYEVNITLMDSVPLINADDVWLLDEDENFCADSGKECLTGEGITIGIIDTGVDYTHEDLRGDGPICSRIGTRSEGWYSSEGFIKYDNCENCEAVCKRKGWYSSCDESLILLEECVNVQKVIGGYDFVNNDNDPMDDHGHGTHCAGIAAGKGVLKGVAPDAKLYAYKVLDSGGGGYSDDIISAIERSIDPNEDGDFSDHLDIISLSLGGPGNPDDPMSQAIDNVVDAGVTAIVAAGNSGPTKQTIGSPGTARKAITIGASDKYDTLAGFSSRGPVLWGDEENEKYLIKPDVLAPGVNICSAQSSNKPWNDRQCIDGEHVAISGTSMATPHVAGAVALLKQKNPNWTPEEIKRSLKGTAVDLDFSITEQGYGRVDILEAIYSKNSPDELPEFIITYPLKTRELFFTNKDSILIKGIFPEDYENLIVDYSLVNSENWNNDGVKIIGSRGIIAEVDFSLLSGGSYNFRVQIAKDGKILRDIILINVVESNLGWPKSFYDFFLSSPTAVDIDKEINGKEIILNNYRGKVYLLNSDGAILEGWPVDVGAYSQATISDIDGDDLEEIIIAGWKGISILNKDGSMYEKGSWPKEVYTYRSPTIFDIDNNGLNEIILPVSPFPLEYKHDTTHLYVWDNKGISKKGWPQYTGDSEIKFSEVAVANMDEDEELEIVAGTLGRDWRNRKTESMEMFLFNHDGTILKGWPQEVIGWIESAPVAGDIDADGDLEIVAVTGSKVYAWHHDGTFVSGWPISLSNLQTKVPPVIANLDEDDKLEIIFCTSLPEGALYVYDDDGTILKGWPIFIESSKIEPIVGDINNDGNMEAIANTYNFLYVWNNDGTLFEGFPLYFEDGGGSDREPFPLLDDIDNDGFLEILHLSYKGDAYLINLDAPYNQDTMEWPMFQHDSQHTGNYNYIEALLPERFQSKIVNNGDFDLEGVLIMRLQKKVKRLFGPETWVTEKVVTIQEMIIAPEEIIKLDVGGEYGWNLRDVKARTSGDYRVSAEFLGKNASWEFKVV